MKKMIIYIIIGVVVVLVLISGYLSYKNTKLVDKNVVEYKDFSCPGMTGFTFKYPVFLGYEVKKAEMYDENTCNVFLNNSQPGVGNSGFSIYKEPKSGNPTLSQKKNSNNVLYNIIKAEAPGSKDKLQFYSQDYNVVITSLPQGMPLQDQFFQTVIESFKLTTDNNVVNTSNTELTSINIEPFKEYLKAQPAVHLGQIYIIDDKLVFIKWSGLSSDASYGYQLFGQTKAELYASTTDSIAGPRITYNNPQYKDLFDKILVNPEAKDLGLGADYSVKSVYNFNSLNSANW